MVEIYTDGACTGNPGAGGYGTLLRYKERELVLSKGFRLTTNNRMELLGAIVGLEALRKKGQQVTFYTDSQYVAKAIQKGWLKAWVAKNFKGKKNEDLWRRYLQAAAPHQVTFQWIKGHAGHPENERCDQLATQAAQQGPWEIDEAYEQATSKVKTPTRGRS